MASEEMIRENMERTRESLTEKLDALENRVIGSVEEATTAVKETVSTVKETMHDSVESVKETVSTVKESMHDGVESVKDAFDVQAHVDHHPWLAFGGAILGGYVLANVLRREISPARRFTLTPDKSPPDEPRRAPEPKPKRSMAEGLLGALEPEIQHLKGLALGVTLGTVREMVAKDVPPHLADQLRAIMDSVTTKVGGEPIASADLPFQEPPAGAQESTGSGV